MTRPTRLATLLALRLSALGAVMLLGGPASAGTPDVDDTRLAVSATSVRLGFTPVRTYYVDGSDGNDSQDGRTPATARKSLHSSMVWNQAIVLLKRGTAIRLASNLYPANAFIGAYGEAPAQPTIVVPAGSAFGIAPDSGEFHIRDVALLGNTETRLGKTTAIAGGKAARLVIEECTISDFANGVVFGGKGGSISNNVITRVGSNGLFGGRNDFAPPSDYLIRGNHIDATGAVNDAITLHDGTGEGTGNQIVENTLIGGKENAVDIQDHYRNTLVQGNVIRNTGLYGIVTSPGSTGTVIRGNIISDSISGAIYSRGDGAIIDGNRVSRISSQRDATGVVVSGDALITNNVIEVPADSQRAAINIMVTEGRRAPAGVLIGNTIRNQSDVATLHVSLPPGATTTPAAVARQWLIDLNHYTVTTADGRQFAGKTFTEWQRTDWGAPFPSKDTNSSLQIGR